MHCSGKCKQYKVTPGKLWGSRYIPGHKRCSNCGIFIKWEDFRCPCCKSILKTSTKYKKKTEDDNKVEYLD